MVFTERVVSAWNHSHAVRPGLVRDSHFRYGGRVGEITGLLRLKKAARQQSKGTPRRVDLHCEWLRLLRSRRA